MYDKMIEQVYGGQVEYDRRKEAYNSSDNFAFADVWHGGDRRIKPSVDLHARIFNRDLKLRVMTSEGLDTFYKYRNFGKLKEFTSIDEVAAFIRETRKDILGGTEERFQEIIGFINQISQTRIEGETLLLDIGGVEFRLTTALDELKDDILYSRLMPSLDLYEK